MKAFCPHLADGALRQLAVPLVFNLFDLSLGIDVDRHNRIDDFLRLDALDDIFVGELQLDGIASRNHLVRLDGDGIEQRWKAIPLGRVLGVSCGYRKWILKGCVLGPEAEVLECWVSCEELRQRSACRWKRG